MSDLQLHYESMTYGYWAEEDPETCPCHGHGWALSEVDTWHKCPVHFAGQAHPEVLDDEEESAQEFSVQAVQEPVPVDSDDIPF